MRLDFNVLWIDNQPQNIKSYQERFNRAVRLEGFRLNVTDALTYSDAQLHLGGDVFLDGIDLVVVDYDLGNDVPKGDEAVRELRKLAQYKDIILYSAVQTVDLKKKVLDAGIEGIFCSHRDDLTDTLRGVFEALVKKVLDIDHIRGIVMGVTSDIDHIVGDCLTRIEPALDSAQLQVATTYIAETLNDAVIKLSAVRDQFNEDRSIARLLGHHGEFTSVPRLRLLKKLLGESPLSEHRELGKAIGKYINGVPPLRNKLGHVRLVASGTKRELRGGAAVEITREQLLKLRIDLVVYRDHFDTLLALFPNPELTHDASETTPDSLT